jgi:hypothetical protein
MPFFAQKYLTRYTSETFFEEYINYKILQPWADLLTNFSKAHISKSPYVQKNGKKYLFHGNLLLNLSLGLSTLQKTSIYACFLSPNRPNSEKR